MQSERLRDNTVRPFLNLKLVQKYLPFLLFAWWPIGLLFAQNNPSSQESEKAIRLIVRADDMGFCHAVNEACIETYRKGIVRSVEIMPPTPWFREAAKLLKENPDLDVGIHLTLTSEWENVKWRPLTHCPSLTDAQGYFYPMIFNNPNYQNQALQEQDWKLAEIEQELRAQIELALQEVPQISHLSGHMGCTRMDEKVTELTEKLAQEYGLAIQPDALGVQSVRYEGPHKTLEEKVASFTRMLEGLTPGTYLFVDHPAYNTPEVQAIYHIGYEDVATDRQGVTDLFTHEAILEVIRRKGIQLISYADLVKTK